MMTSRRVMLSLACTLLAVITFFLWSALGLIDRSPQPLGQFLRSSAEIFPVYLLSALLGWLVALPFVILIKNAEGWRAWAVLITGVSIGPGLIALPGVIKGYGPFTPGDSFLLLASLIISLPTTVFYVFALKVAHRRSLASGQVIEQD